VLSILRAGTIVSLMGKDWNIEGSLTVRNILCFSKFTRTFIKPTADIGFEIEQTLNQSGHDVLSNRVWVKNSIIRIRSGGTKWIWSGNRMEQSVQIPFRWYLRDRFRVVSSWIRNRSPL
jgi:hypothetical protein